MSRIAVIGDSIRVEPFALSGAIIAAADTPEDVCSAWSALPADVAVVVLTPLAAIALSDAGIAPRDDTLTVTLP
jgi:vacuolar-type H+-ATPase subunit F/Vma7